MNMRAFVRAGAACAATGFVFTAGLSFIRADDPMQVPGPVIDALSQTDDLAFTGRFCGWLETLDADTIASARTVVAAGWRSDAWPEARQAQALGWLDQRWAALDGAKFIEVCAKRTERCSSSAQAAALWVEFARDRESAMRRFAELSLRDDPPAALGFLVKAAAADPAWLVRRCQQLPEWDAKDAQLQSALYSVWAERDPTAAWVAMLEEPNENIRYRIALHLLWSQLGKPPAQAVAWLKATPNDTDRHYMAKDFVGGLNRWRRRAEALPILKLWDDPHGWNALASQRPYDIKPEVWVKEIIPLIPSQHRVRALQECFEGGSYSVPQEGEPSNIVFDAIGEAALQAEVREAARRSGRINFGQKTDPRPPPADPALLRTAFWEEPDVFHRLARVHGFSVAKWVKDEYRRDLDGALKRLLARKDTGELNYDAIRLAELLTPAQRREKTLWLLDQPGEAARVAALAFARRWLEDTPEDAVRTLDAHHPVALGVLLTGDFNMIEQLTSRFGVDRVRKLFGLIGHPALRDAALREIVELFPGAAEPVAAALARITAMPPGAARSAASDALGSHGRLRTTTPPTALLQQMLELDPTTHGEVRDSLLAFLAGFASCFGDGSGPAMVDLARGIGMRTRAGRF